MTDWICIRALFTTAPEDWSLFADAYDRFGCPGSIQSDSPLSLSGFLSEVEGAATHAEALKEELLRLGAAEVEISVVPDEDWSELWKIHFKPRLIGQRIWVRPTWEEAPAGPGQIEIVLDPGQAFGTGDHPTTRVCLRLMETIDMAGKSGYDLGCGSGILAIAAIKLGISEIVASDIDPISVVVTRENAELNGVKFPTLEGSGFLAEGQFGIVISNIISATLIRYAAEIWDRVKPGGDWIASGIIETNWQDVLNAAIRVGFELVATVNEDEWVGAHFKRRTTSDEQRAI